MPSIVVIAGPDKDAMEFNSFFRDLVPGKRLNVFAGKTVTARGLNIKLKRDKDVADKHCKFEYDGKVLTLRALSSKKKTFVLQGRKSRLELKKDGEFALAAGDRIQIGTTILRIDDDTYAAGKSDEENNARRDRKHRDVLTYPTG